MRKFKLAICEQNFTSNSYKDIFIKIYGIKDGGDYDRCDFIKDCTFEAYLQKDNNVIMFNTMADAEKWVADHNTDIQIQAELDRMQIETDKYCKDNHIQLDEGFSIQPVVEGEIESGRKSLTEIERF